LERGAAAATNLAERRCLTTTGPTGRGVAVGVVVADDEESDVM